MYLLTYLLNGNNQIQVYFEEFKLLPKIFGQSSLYHRYITRTRYTNVLNIIKADEVTDRLINKLNGA